MNRDHRSYCITFCLWHKCFPVPVSCGFPSKRQKVITKNCYNNRLTALIITPTMLAVYQTESSIRMQKKLQQSVFLFAEMTQGVSEEVCRELLWLSVFFLWRFPVCCLPTCLPPCLPVLSTTTVTFVKRELPRVTATFIFKANTCGCLRLCLFFFYFVGSFDKEDTISMVML